MRATRRLRRLHGTATARRFCLSAQYVEPAPAQKDFGPSGGYLMSKRITA
jgi:hypothetical protein